MGFIETNPIVGAFKPKRAPGRSRVLTDDELRKIWENVGDVEYGKIVRLLILTGARAQEIGGMQWPEIDLDGGTWMLPGERSKNRRPHTLPITGSMRSILETVPQRFENDFLFGRRGFQAWSFCKRALDERIGIAHWTVHDVRRSVATKLGDIGIQPHIIEEILNHRGHRRGVAGTYNRSPYEREVRAAMAAWSDHIRALVTGGERTVIAFPA
jgi:integrase